MSVMQKSAVAILWVVFLLAPGALQAQADTAGDDESNFKYQVVRTKEGLNFRVPEDMPLQMKDGIQTPIPFDEYVYGKFGRLEKRMDGIEARIARLEKRLNESLAADGAQASGASKGNVLSS